MPEKFFKVPHLLVSIRKWQKASGEVIRNTLVRGYIDVDRTIVYEVLQNGPGDIADVKRTVARFH